MGKRSDFELTSRQQRWLTHIEAWEKSGGSMKDYATVHNLPIKEFYHWKRWFGDKGWLSSNQKKKPRFKQIKVVPDDPTSPVLRVTLPNGVLIEMAGPLTASTMNILLKAAGAIS